MTHNNEQHWTESQKVQQLPGDISALANTMHGRQHFQKQVVIESGTATSNSRRIGIASL